MKKILSVVYLVFFIQCLLFSQDNLLLEPYDDLHPEVSILQKNQSRNERNLLFFSRNRHILSYNTSTGRLIYLEPNPAETSEGNITTQHFWDPFTRNNYVRLSGNKDGQFRNGGWYVISFENGNMAFHLQNKNTNWAQNSIPFRDLADKYFFNVQYEFEKEPGNDIHSHKTFSKITDKNSGRILWLYGNLGAYFTDFFWITDAWYIKRSSPGFAAGSWERVYSIFNYVSGEAVSFAPECIIGYGDGVVLTTNEIENGFMGISVWTPKKELLYKDSFFSISGVINRTYNASKSHYGIWISYFDYPYIYCSVGRVLNIGIPYATIIMNIENGKTFITPETYHVIGIFETGGTTIQTYPSN
jgi:hypothetical protein